MSNISYSRDELVRLFSSWNSILQSWDDKKSRDIDSKYFQFIFQSSKQLMELSDEIHTIVNELENKSDEV